MPGLECPQGIAVIPIRQVPFATQQRDDLVTLRPFVSEVRLDLDIDGRVIAANDRREPVIASSSCISTSYLMKHTR